MNSYKRLINNSIIFAIGNFGSRLISLILVPIYTYYLTTSEFGTLDLVNATIVMVVPIISMDMYDAVLRFVMDEDNSDTEVLSNSLVIIFLGMIVGVISYPILSYYNFLNGYLEYMYLIVFLQIIRMTFSQYTRAMGRMKLFAFSGILLTMLTGIFNIIFLIGLGWGLDGYFRALVFSNIVTIIYLNSQLEIHKNIQWKAINKNMVKSLLRYTIPLVPNTLMWSLINFSSRYFIVSFIGISANGLFAIASKIPAIINTISQIFYQSWVLSAIEEKDNKNISYFYSNVFKYYSSIIFVSLSALVLVIKVIFEVLFASQYFLGWKVAPILLLSTAFSILSSFLGATYISTKETTGVFRTSIYGGISSLILNVLLIPTIGLIGAGISSAVSFLIMFLLRLADTKEHVNLIIDWKLFIINISIILIQWAVLFLSFGIEYELLINLVLLIVMLLFNKHLFKITKIFKKGRK